MKLSQKIFFIVFFLVLDQVTKWMALYGLSHTISLFSFFSLRVAHNTGIAFSFPFPTVLLLLVSAVLLFIVAWELFKAPLSRILSFSFILIFSGGIGNFLDRVVIGSVIDFLSFGNFPIFNLADTYITVGIVLLLWIEFFGAIKSQHQ